jgi:hypothetical protein
MGFVWFGQRCIESGDAVEPQERPYAEMILIMSFLFDETFGGRLLPSALGHLSRLEGVFDSAESTQASWI